MYATLFYCWAIARILQHPIYITFCILVLVAGIILDSIGVTHGYSSLGTIRCDSSIIQKRFCFSLLAKYLCILNKDRKNTFIWLLQKGICILGVVVALSWLLLEKCQKPRLRVKTWLRRNPNVLRWWIQFNSLETFLKRKHKYNFQKSDRAHSRVISYAFGILPPCPLGDVEDDDWSRKWSRRIEQHQEGLQPCWQNGI